MVTAVNDAPTAVGTLPARTALDGAAASYPTAGGFSDPDGDTLSYSATGLPNGLSIDAATGIISGTLDRSDSQIGGGSYAVVVMARDPAGESQTQRFTITVSNPPPAAADDSAATNEDTAVTIAVLPNDRDPDGDPLSVTAATALHGRVTVNPDNTLTYAPDANYNGTDTIRYTISDGQGGTATAIVTITIAPVNDGPVVAAALPARSGIDGGAVSFPTSGGLPIRTATHSPTARPDCRPGCRSIRRPASCPACSIDPPASSAAGVYVVTVSARDPASATAVSTFGFDVANPGPVAADDRATTRPGAPIDIVVLANDADPDGDPLSVTGASAANGSVVIQPDGSIRYTPDPGFVGTDTITYTIADGQGGTDRAVVRIDVVNAVPVGAGQTDLTAVDGQLITLPVGARFSDADGDPLRFSATGLPPGLRIDPDTGAITGTIDRSASRPRAAMTQSSPPATGAAAVPASPSTGRSPTRPRSRPATARPLRRTRRSPSPSWRTTAILTAIR